MPRALVLKSPGYAGLGDLLLALDRALLVAHATDRQIVIDWRDTPYSREGVNLFDELFSHSGAKVLPVSALASAEGGVTPSAWQGFLDLPMRQLYGRLRSDEWNRPWAGEHLDAGLAALEADAPWVVLWDHSHPNLPAMAVRQLGAGVPLPLSRQLLPLEPIQAAITTFRNRHFQRPMLGVHGRAATEAVRAGKSASLPQLVERIDQLLAEHPSTGLFLASDNHNLIAAIRSRYPAVAVRGKWLPEPGEPLHLAPLQESYCLQIARDAVVDLWLLAACDWIIHPAASSFSLAACRLSGLPSSRLHPLQPPSSSPSVLGRVLRSLRSFRRILKSWFLPQTAAR